MINVKAEWYNKKIDRKIYECWMGVGKVLKIRTLLQINFIILNPPIYFLIHIFFNFLCFENMSYKVISIMFFLWPTLYLRTQTKEFNLYFKIIPRSIDLLEFFCKICCFIWFHFFSTFYVLKICLITLKTLVY